MRAPAQELELVQPSVQAQEQAPGLALVRAHASAQVLMHSWAPRQAPELVQAQALWQLLLRVSAQVMAHAQVPAR